MEQKDEFCPVCCMNNMSNRLELYQLNFNSAVYMCKYPGCVYPEGFNWVYVDRNIFDNEGSDDSDYDFDREIKEKGLSKLITANIGYNIKNCDNELNIKYNITQSDDTQLNNLIINIENTSLLESNQMGIDNAPVVLAESDEDKSPNMLMRLNKLPNGQLTQITPRFAIKALLPHSRTDTTTKNTQTSKGNKKYAQTAQTMTNPQITDQSLSGIQKDTQNGIENNIESAFQHSETAQIITKTIDTQRSKGIENTDESVLQHSETAQIITKTIDTQRSKRIENTDMESVLQHSETAQIITKTIDTPKSKGIENEGIESVLQHSESAQIVTKTKIEPLNKGKQKKSRASKKESKPKELATRQSQRIKLIAMTAQNATETENDDLTTQTIENHKMHDQTLSGIENEAVLQHSETAQIDAEPIKKTKIIKLEVQWDNEIKLEDNTLSGIKNEHIEAALQHSKTAQNKQTKTVKHIKAQLIKRTKHKKREFQWENEMKLDYSKVFISKVNHKCKKDYRRHGLTESLVNQLEHETSKIKTGKKHTFEGFKFRTEIIRPAIKSEPLLVQTSLKTENPTKNVDAKIPKILDETIQKDVQLEENVLDEFFSNIDNIQPIPVPENAVSVTDIDDWLQKL